MEKCAVFSCKGLGDGLIALVLAHNLYLCGYQPIFFHPFLSEMQSLFPKIPIRPFPQEEELSSFERFYIIYEKSPWMQKILTYCETHFKERTFVLNPIATSNRDYPYWEVGQFDGRFPFADNLAAFCARHLQLKHASKENGIVVPKKNRNLQRIVIHPSSSRPGKNWPKEKFIALAALLEQSGYQPVFILTEEEKKLWPNKRFFSPEFSSLQAMAEFVAESGFMIGNDSGIGHLASCLGLSTVTIARSRNMIQFWRPAWGSNILVLPPSWLPNIKGLRLRDRYWKQAICVSRVFEAFQFIKK